MVFRELAVFTDWVGGGMTVLSMPVAIVEHIANVLPGLIAFLIDVRLIHDDGFFREIAAAEKFRQADADHGHVFGFNLAGHNGGLGRWLDRIEE